jgi:hypothetical protein
MHQLTVGLRRILALLAMVFSSVVVVGCGDTICSNQEISRTASGDGRVEAVVTERDCGATTRLATRIHIVPKGRTTSNDETVVFVADGASGIKTQWPNSGILKIS